MLVLLYSGIINRGINVYTCGVLLFLYVLYIVFVVKHDKQEREVKAKQEWMFNEMRETTFKHMHRAEFLNLMDDEQAYHLGINLSGNISGTSSVIYDGQEIKPDEMLHFGSISNESIDEERVSK
eukprot:CAMPEP_0168318138 /NCGR_PEP_ID=MMETSP0213-20121227/301_1 /TAXON_ID=151035 /ORGANISM="Euplotes harpa, Strain FSP1.4" /LENGTH=123 /DNA_ID=CAMNT_0008319149 /DNA_START=434 /DNA_END=805 /DNA_ORIENTATION=+